MTSFSRAAPSAADPKGGQPPQRGKEAARAVPSAPSKGGQPGERGWRNAISVCSRRRSKGVGRTTRKVCSGEGEGGAKTQLVRGAK